MSYPKKPLTRLNSKLAFDHVFAIFDPALTVPILEALNQEGITNLIDFISEDNQAYDGLEYVDTAGAHFLTKPETRLVKKIHEWLVWELQEYPSIDLESMIMDDYDEFCLSKTIAPKIPLQVQSPIPMATPSSLVSSNPIVTQTSFLTNVKLDIKQYPIFNGDVGTWSKFKRGVLSIASTHNLDEIFKENTIVPTPSDPNYTMFQSKNKFVYSI